LRAISQLLGQLLGQREQVPSTRIASSQRPVARASRRISLLRRRVVGRQREAAQHLVQRAGRIRTSSLADLGAQAQQLDALARFRARARHPRVDVQQPAPVLVLVGQALQVGQQLAPGRIGGQRVAQRA
jgi:hypothetical protein